MTLHLESSTNGTCVAAGPIAMNQDRSRRLAPKHVGPAITREPAVISMYSLDSHECLHDLLYLTVSLINLYSLLIAIEGLNSRKLARAVGITDFSI